MAASRRDIDLGMQQRNAVRLGREKLRVQIAAIGQVHLVCVGKEAEGSASQVPEAQCGSRERLLGKEERKDMDL